MRGDISGSNGLPKPERMLGKIACQETGGHAQAYGMRCRGIRATRRRLDCMNPSLQKVQKPAHRKDACNRCRPLRQGMQVPAVILWGAERCPVRTSKETNGTPKSR